MCNYCTLREIRKEARGRARVHLRRSSGGMGGVDVFVVPKGEKLDTSVDEKGNHNPQWKAWLMEVSDHCVCEDKGYEYADDY